MTNLNLTNLSFRLISYSEDGNRIQVANQTPSFYALVLNGTVVDYYGTLEALQVAVCSIKALVKLENHTETTLEFQISDVKLAG